MPSAGTAARALSCQLEWTGLIAFVDDTEHRLIRARRVVLGRAETSPGPTPGHMFGTGRSARIDSPGQTER